MNLLLFISILIISFIIVRIGAIAFELTGLEWSLAKFQALSCFTGTGFTTKESELITGNIQRRHIASVLIVLGHAGLVTLIATFANSLRTDISIPKFTIPFLHSVVPSHLLPWINLAIIAVGLYVFYKIFTNTRLATKLTDALRSHIVKKEIIKPVSFEELMVVTGGYGISQIEICENSPILEKTLLDSGLKEFDILILAMERGEEIIPNPSADTKILLGDTLICFGKLKNIRDKLCVMSK
ncbi:MAG: hypothetical protein ISS44_04615 [Candidatus Omnitrophica bacterium]|nr:hypothetical protein [Candidatus Omnitrophota bacterium]